MTYQEEMVDCPCRQGSRCAMHGDFCNKKNCGPLFVQAKHYFRAVKVANLAYELDGKTNPSLLT